MMKWLTALLGIIESEVERWRGREGAVEVRAEKIRFHSKLIQIKH